MTNDYRSLFDIKHIKQLEIICMWRVNLIARFNLEKWIPDDEILKAVKNATKDNMGPVSSALAMQCPRSDMCSINMIIFIVSTIFMFVLAIVSVVGGSKPLFYLKKLKRRWELISWLAN